MAGMNFRDASEFDPEIYGGVGGGLPGVLRRAMPQQSRQQSADPGSTLNGASEYNHDSYGSPQGGLVGRLLALQAEQSRYQPLPRTNGPAPSLPQNLDFRQVSRAPIVAQPQGAVAPSNLSNDQSSPAQSPSGADLAARPEHSFFDRLQAYWDHPDPHGLFAVLKEARNGVVQAVQGSIDATSVPSTEEEAFRQNLGRELGPIGAFKAVSLRAPLTRGGTSGVLRSISNLLMSRAASTAMAGINPLSPKPVAAPGQPTGGPPAIVSGQPMPQWPFSPPIWGPRR